MVKIDDSFSESGAADAFSVPYTRRGQAYKGRGDDDIAREQLFNNDDILK